MKSASVEVVDQWIVWEGALLPGYWVVESGVPVFGDLPGGGPVGWTMHRSQSTDPATGASGAQQTWAKVSLVLPFVEQMAHRLGVEELFVRLQTPSELRLSADRPFAGSAPVWVAPPPRYYSPPVSPRLFAEASTVDSWKLVPAELIGRLAQLQLPADDVGKIAGLLVENAVGLHAELRCTVDDPMCPEPGGHDHDDCRPPGLRRTADSPPAGAAFTAVESVDTALDLMGELDVRLCQVVHDLRTAKMEVANMRRSR